jgi:hypothetical protein
MTALPNGQIYVGNAANVATAVAMSKDATISNTGAVTLSNNATARSDIGLGTTDTPQFARLGLGIAANATIFLTADGAGAAGDFEVLRIKIAAGNPYINIGNAGGGLLVQYLVAPNQLRIGVQGSVSIVDIDSSGNMFPSGGVFCQNNISTATGVYQVQGNTGVSQTFDIGSGNTQITFTGGIATAIA